MKKNLNRFLYPQKFYVLHNMMFKCGSVFSQCCWSFKNFQFHFFKLCNINQAAISEHVPCIYLNIFIPSTLHYMDAYGVSAKCQCVNTANYPVGKTKKRKPTDVKFEGSGTAARVVISRSACPASFSLVLNTSTWSPFRDFPPFPAVWVLSHSLPRAALCSCYASATPGRPTTRCLSPEIQILTYGYKIKNSWRFSNGRTLERQYTGSYHLDSRAASFLSLPRPDCLVTHKSTLASGWENSSLRTYS